MNKFFLLFILMNLILSGLYLWGADNNRYICACMWFAFPILNAILYGIFENKINEEF